MNITELLNKKLHLIKENSPLYEINYSLENKKVIMKRDDLIDFGIGGNKTRILEYIMFDVINKGCHKVITFGSIYSNHIRIVASIAYALDLECNIIIIHDEKIDRENSKGNLFLTDLYGAKLYYCKTNEAKEYIDNFLEEQENKKDKYYFIPGGGHSAIGCLGYIAAIKQISDQCSVNNIKAECIVLPTGTGTTQAGLIYGCKLFNLNFKIVGFSIARKSERCKKEITNLLKELNDLTCNNYSFSKDDLIVIDDYLDEYGKINDFEIKVMKDLMKKDGILLDPIYNLKAFSSMIKMTKENKLNFENIIYLNTGGSPNLYNDKFRKGWNE